MISRVYRRDITGKKIPSTFNQREQKTQCVIENRDMSYESNKNITKNVNKIDKTLIFSYDVSYCKLYNVMNEIPINTKFGNYGVLKDLLISNIKYINETNDEIKKCLDNLSVSEKLIYTKVITLHFLVISNNISANDITINGHALIFKKEKNKINKCRTKSIFRLPIKGYRKSVIMCDSNKSTKKNIYMDNYAKSNCGSGCRYDASCNLINSVFSRTKYPVIRSGMLDDGKSFRSYRDYLRNGNMASYDRSLEKNRNNKDDCTSCKKNVYYKNSTHSTYNMNKNRTLRNSEIRTIYKPSNNKFKVQGAVSSSSRIDRLKLDTITKSNKKCKNKGTLKCKDNYGCEPYFAGKPRFTGWMYNKKHKETVRYDRKQMSLGIPQHQKYKTTGSINCKKCNNKSRVEGSCCKK